MLSKSLTTCRIQPRPRHGVGVSHGMRRVTLTQGSGPRDVELLAVGSVVSLIKNPRLRAARCCFVRCESESEE